MKKKQVAGMGLLIPKKMRIGGMTFYKRQGQVIGRVSESMEKRSNTQNRWRSAATRCHSSSNGNGCATPRNCGKCCGSVKRCSQNEAMPIKISHRWPTACQ